MSEKIPSAAREGSLEAPTRHPIAWKEPDFLNEAVALQGTGTRVRYLSRVSPLLQPVQFLPDVVRCHRRVEYRRTRWRRREGLLERRRSLLSVRHVLHVEVSVRAAASVERRLSPPDAARQGLQVQKPASARARQDPQCDRYGRHPGGHSGRRGSRECGEQDKDRAVNARQGAGGAPAGARPGVSQPHVSQTP